MFLTGEVLILLVFLKKEEQGKNIKSWPGRKVAIYFRDFFVVVLFCALVKPLLDGNFMWFLGSS